MPQFTKKISAGSRVYYFDVRVDRKDSRYITITEITKATGSRSRVFVHAEDFARFRDALNAAVDHISDTNANQS